MTATARKHRRAAWIALGLVAAVAAADEPCRVLYVANYLFGHGTPYYEMVHRMVDRGGFERPLLRHQVGEVHGSFMDHVQHRVGLDWIAGDGTPRRGRGGSDRAEFAAAPPAIVVVQVSLGGRWDADDRPPERLVEGLERYRRACRAAGSRMILCATPGRQFQGPEPRDGVTAEAWRASLDEELAVLRAHLAYAATELDFEVAPMPLAFGALRRAAPDLNLHAGGDVYHLTPKDGYLAALCLALTILGDETESLPAAPGLRQAFNTWAERAGAGGPRSRTIAPLAAAEQASIHEAVSAAVRSFREQVATRRCADEDAARRAEALAAKGPAGVATLVADLVADTPGTARHAARVLGPAATEEAVAPMIEALATTDRKLAEHLVGSLATVAGRSETAVRALRQAAESGTDRRAIRAAAALARSGTGRAAHGAAVLARALKEDDRSRVTEAMDRAVALAGMDGLATTARETLVTALAGVLKHRDASLRVRAVEGLGSLGPRAQAAAPTLREGILSGASYKAAAAAALKKIEPGKKVNTRPTLDALGGMDDDLGF